jgi:RNA polymerase sigma-70 factor (ECF subfamily)
MRIDAALSKLPVTERNLIDMVYLQGIPYKKIADLLRIREGTLRCQAHRAINKLRSLIAMPPESFG